MKKVLLTSLLVVVIFTLAVFAVLIVSFSAKPATDIKIKEVLEASYRKVKKSEINEYLKAIKLLEKDNEDSVFVRQEIDYKNYLYVIKCIKKIDTLKTPKELTYQKSLVLENKYVYSITIKDAFYDIDPNNFAPN